MVKMYQNLSPESKEIMTKTLNAFLQIGKSNIRIRKPSLKLGKK